MKRSSLHPRVHLIMGGLIAGFSGYLLLFVDIENQAIMQVFLVIGLCFFGYGLLKAGIKYIKSGKLREKEEQVVTKLTGIPQRKTDVEYQREIQRQKQLHQPRIVLCSLCSTQNYETSNYCHMCGYKLR